jgi:hypothetical protein
MAKKKVSKRKVSKKVIEEEVAPTGERVELLLRIIVGIFYGIVLEIWKALVIVLTVINWIIVLFVGRRNKNIAEFCEYWNSEKYRYMRYMTMVSNEKPFPFTEMVRVSRFS